jgi:hypothetical protein
VFTARYALSPYIKQTRFVFKGLIYRLCGPNYHSAVILATSEWVCKQPGTWNLSDLNQCKLVPLHAVKANRRNGWVAPVIIISGATHPHLLPNRGSRWGWVFNFTLLLLYPSRKKTLYPSYRRLGWLQNRSARFGENKLFFFSKMNTNRRSCGL